MSADEFAARVNKLIDDAHEEGVSLAEIKAELELIVHMMTELVQQTPI